MNNLLIFMCLLCLGMPDTRAQDLWSTRSGAVRINASTPLEDIDATNQRVNTILRPDDEAFAVVLLITEFRFRRRLMQEHFNENYMESGKFPKATFEGRIEGVSGMAPGETRECLISGILTVHGVARSREVMAEVRRAADGWLIRSTFTVHTADHGIDIPKIVFSKIAEDVTVQLDATLKPRESGGQ